MTSRTDTAYGDKKVCTQPVILYCTVAILTKDSTVHDDKQGREQCTITDSTAENPLEEDESHCGSYKS